ncbi:MAG: hypothetical protein VX370_00610 [Bacteroidota bacterium]|nr:hypothetical protein [Bacteroidota bacterium]
MKFIQTILIVVLIYYSLKLFFRIAVPFFIQLLLKRSEKKFHQFFQKSNPKKETNTSSNKKQNLNTDNSGEYVDFEEVD